jgi:hypothetical protein
MAKQKMLPQKATVQDLSAQIAFWEQHLAKVKKIYDEDSTEANATWVSNVTARLTAMKLDEASNDGKPKVVKPKF